MTKNEEIGEKEKRRTVNDTNKLERQHGHNNNNNNNTNINTIIDCTT